MNLLSAHAGVAIRNASLYQAEHVQSTRIRALAAVNQGISSTLDLDLVLKTITESAAQLTGVRFVTFWLGDHRTRRFYRLCVSGAFALVLAGVVVDAIDGGRGLPAWSLLAFGAVAAAIEPMGAIGKASGRALIAVLVGTARLQVVFGVLLALGLWIHVLIS